VDAPGKTKDLLQAAPMIETPKGGGAISGIGEKFEANPVTGSASLEVPLPFPPGRGGLTPSLSLSYDSGAGNGVFGLGWSLSLPAIRRKTDKQLPRYRDASTAPDTFVLSGFEDLVPVGSASAIIESSVTYSVQRYQPRIEGGFALIQRWTDASTGAVHWRTRSAQNVLRRYGSTSASQTRDPADATRIFAWYVDWEEDELGNVIRYVYDVASGASPTSGLAETGRTSTYTYLKRVQYGNKTPGTLDDGWYFEVVLDYGEHDDDALAPHVDPTVRSDPFSNHKPGFDVRCFRLCSRVLVFHRFATDATDALDAAASLVRSLDFTYTPSAVATTLQSVTLTGYAADGTPASMPSLDFTYVAASPASAPEFLTGIDDLPQGIDFSRAQWVDLDGEGLQGLLTEDGAGWWYKRNEGSGRLGAWRRLPTRPGPALAATQLSDLDGDGRLEVFQRGPPHAGSWSRTADGGWDRFRPFAGIPHVAETPATTRSLDVDGDGRADLLFADAQGLLVFRSDGVRGWKAPERVRRAADEADGPVLLFANAKESLFLADMDGDGLVDLVRVRHASVCYWPNLGYGRFGARVQMANAPFLDRAERFDPKRVRLADVDGAGPADLIYVGPDRVRWWSNQSGNGFSTTANVPNLPGVADPITVTVADLRGDGTACLVWASPLGRDRHTPLRYLRLMSAGKPYLLASVTNNLGLTTTLQYTPSTSFYLADRRAGTPWATRLPFPVQCLTQVTREDAVTGLTTVTTYAYHHGYFDGVEREFRGFGKVEQWDAESFPEGGATTDLPPVRTVTWFHTGAWEAENRLLAAYATEYFAGDSAAFSPAEMTFGINIALAGGGTMLREAHRALKGKPLRVEVYAEDGLLPTSSYPYTVTTSSYGVSTVRMRSGDTPGVFLVYPTETLTYHYERNQADPRIEQQITLAVDSYGVVTRAATVQYPRRPPSTGTHDDEQTRGHCRITRTEVIHDTSGTSQWHIGLPYRTRTWRLQPEATASTSTFYTDKVTAADIAPLVALPVVTGSGTATTPVLAWDDAEPTDRAWLKKLADTVTTYDDGGSELPAGTVGERALVHQKYQLVYTPTQQAALDALRSAAPLSLSATLLDEGYSALTSPAFTGITDVDGTWARSGTQARDAGHFYVPTTFTDPWGNETTVAWHGSYLFPASVTDALDNVVAATYDLRALAPSQATDPNGNLALAAYDALGRVTALALQSKAVDSHGTPLTVEGDTLADPTQSFEYHPEASPPYTFARARETHGDAGTRWIETTAYSDGTGHVVQAKVTAAPDEATPTTPRWIGTGRVVLNNKGLPIKQYEPFFADTADFEAEAGFAGVTPILTYDPIGRPVQVDLPNKTVRRVEFDPWQQVTWDENDLVAEAVANGADTDLTDAVPTSHADTPTTVSLDVQGRVYKTEEYTDAALAQLVTRLTLDAVGNPTVVTDARGIAVRTQTFDMVGRPIAEESSDGGDTTAILDAAGQPRFLFKSGDLGIETESDALRRTVRTWEWNTATGAKALRERLVYGEALKDGTTYEPADDDLRGRVVRSFETAGSMVPTYDWKGNPTSETWCLLADIDTDVDWSGADSAYPLTGPDDATLVAALDAAAGSSGVGESTTAATTRTFDALNRVVTEATPDTSVTTNTYDAGGKLTSIGVDIRGSGTVTAFVDAILYNARGQRTRIDYGNGVSAAYAYDSDTFRLTRVHATNGSTNVQDLNFAYDPVGNIVAITDAADSTVFFDNAAVTPNRTFTYDAMYRLVEATGREKNPNPVPSWIDPSYGPVAAANAIAVYTQTFAYDEVGNILEIEHDGIDDWSRAYTYATDSNRLDSTDETTTSGTVTSSYEHDDRGNMTRMPHLGTGTNIVPDFRDLVRTVVLAGTAGSLRMFYDRSGKRVRKVKFTGSTILEDRRTFGRWETWSDGTDTLDTLHVMDGESRVAMVETKAGTTVQRFQLGDHLGTAQWELDGSGNVLSYEEYHPYGSTAWWAHSTSVSLKRYKYTGMERDEETGLQCHGVRYYAPWLGRWASADPIGLGDGVNRYLYSHASPLTRIDPSGMAAPTMKSQFGVSDEQIEASLRADPSLSNQLSLTAKATAYGAYDVLTAGFVSAHDALLEKRFSGEISESEYWKGTTIRAGASTAIIVGGAYLGPAGTAAPATRSATSMLLEGTARGALTGVGTDLVSQTVDIGIGVQDEYSLVSTLLSGGGGALFGALGTARKISQTRFDVVLNRQGDRGVVAGLTNVGGGPLPTPQELATGLRTGSGMTGAIDLTSGKFVLLASGEIGPPGTNIPAVGQAGGHGAALSALVDLVGADNRRFAGFSVSLNAETGLWRVGFNSGVINPQTYGQGVRGVPEGPDRQAILTALRAAGFALEGG
jgi:RHS repeat-associated protein